LSTPIALDWILTAPRGFQISFLQGLFERAGEVDVATRSVTVRLLPAHAPAVFRLLTVLQANPQWKSQDPPVIKVGAKEAAALPLFHPKISDNFTLVKMLAER
jgi:hypothetical protein